MRSCRLGASASPRFSAPRLHPTPGWSDFYRTCPGRGGQLTCRGVLPESLPLTTKWGGGGDLVSSRPRHPGTKIPLAAGIPDAVDQTSPFSRATRMQDTAQRVTGAEFLPEWVGVLRRCPSPISPLSIAVLEAQARWNDPSRVARIGRTPRGIGWLSRFPSIDQALDSQLVNGGVYPLHLNTSLKVWPHIGGPARTMSSQQNAKINQNNKQSASTNQGVLFMDHDENNPENRRRLNTSCVACEASASPLAHLITKSSEGD